MPYISDEPYSDYGQNRQPPLSYTLHTYTYGEANNSYFPLVRDVYFSRLPTSYNASWIREFLSSIIVAIGSVAIMVTAWFLLQPVNAYLVTIMGTLGLIVVALVIAARRIDRRSTY